MKRADTTGSGTSQQGRAAGFVLPALLVAAVAVLAACGGGGGDASPAPTTEAAASVESPAAEEPTETAAEAPPPETAPTETAPAEPPETEPAEPAEAAPVADGEALYVEAGCAGCHGLAGEGTEIGPPVVGHTAAQIRNQVRHPLVTMPAYSEEQLSDAQLDEIVEFVVGLAPTGEHVEPVKLTEIVAIHHWMALSNLEAEDVPEAIHHIDHVIEAVKGNHRKAMRKARAMLERGDIHEAEHLIQDMLVGRVDPGLSPQALHLKLALTAIDERDLEDAIHHLEDYVAVTKGERRRSAKEILGLVQAGNLHDAYHGVEELLGVTPHG